MHPLAAAFLLLGLLPIGEPVTDQVDVIEFNHFYDEEGRHVFDQYLFLDWNGDDARYDIRDWRLVKTTTQAAHHDSARNVYRIDWYDGVSLRTVYGVQFRETWSQFDPELAARSVLPKEMRRELTNPRMRP